MKRLMRYRRAISIPDLPGDPTKRTLEYGLAALVERPKSARLLVQHGLKYQRYEGVCECGKKMGGLFMVSPETGVPITMECWSCSKAVAIKPVGKKE